MDQGSLVAEQIAAGAKLVRDFAAQYKPLKAAFWLKEGDDRPYYLYLAPDQTDDSGVRDAYGAVNRILGPGPHLWLDPFRVKVIPGGHPLARDVAGRQQRFGKFFIWIYPSMLGGRYVAGGYVYPLTVPDAAAAAQG